MARTLLIAWLAIVLGAFAHAAEDEVSAPFGAGKLRARILTDTVYKLKGSELYLFRFVGVGYKEGDKPLQQPTEGFLEIAGEALPVQFGSDDPDKLAIVQPGEKFGGTEVTSSVFRFLAAGDVALTVSVGDDVAIKVPLRIVELPVEADAKGSDVVKALGLPSEKTKIAVSWPDLETHDEIIYKPDAGHPNVGEHWRYKKYPGAVLSIMDGKLYRIGSVNLKTERKR